MNASQLSRIPDEHGIALPVVGRGEQASNRATPVPLGRLCILGGTIPSILAVLAALSCSGDGKQVVAQEVTASAGFDVTAEGESNAKKSDGNRTDSLTLDPEQCPQALEPQVVSEITTLSKCLYNGTATCETVAQAIMQVLGRLGDRLNTGGLESKFRILPAHGLESGRLQFSRRDGQVQADIEFSTPSIPGVLACDDGAAFDALNIQCTWTGNRMQYCTALVQRKFHYTADTYEEAVLSSSPIVGAGLRITPDKSYRTEFRLAVGNNQNGEETWTTTQSPETELANFCVDRTLLQAAISQLSGLAEASD